MGREEEKQERSDEEVKSLPASGSVCVRGREGPALSVQAESE